jgi:hypothetical protein
MMPYQLAPFVTIVAHEAMELVDIGARAGAEAEMM